MHDAIAKLRLVYQKIFFGLSVIQIYTSGDKQKNSAHGGNGIVLVPIRIPVKIERASGDLNLFFRSII